jgi:hypothetical protein
MPILRQAAAVNASGSEELISESGKTNPMRRLISKVALLA